MSDDLPAPLPSRIRSWTRVTLVCTMALLALTLVRVVQLKVAPPAKLSAAAGRRTSERTELALRGEVVDRRGRPLAMSLVGHRLYCDPAFIYERGWDTAKKRAKTDPNAIAECDPLRDAAIALAPVLRTTPQQVHELLKTNAERRYVVLAQEMDEAQVDLVRRLDMVGVGMEPRLVRDYPAGGLAGQLVGKVGFLKERAGSEPTGQAGIEFVFDRELRPVPGHVKALRDVGGRTLWINREDYVPGDPGDDVRLTVDLAIQESAERHLGRMVEEVNAGGGRLVVLDVRNGDILAMADILREREGWEGAPRDPARRTHPALGRNRNLTDPYEPGSTFKSFVWARATQLGAARPEEVIPLPSGPYVTPFGRTIHDVKYPGPVSWKTVLVKSLNGGMACVSLRMTHQDMQRMVQDFGFGTKVAIGIPGESAGIVTAPGKWSKYTQTSVAMGHEIAVTPIQMVRAFSAFARQDGTMVTPRLVLPRGGASADAWMPGSRELIPAGVLADARDAMTGVVEGGTARRAQSANYRMFGKTGTAELAVPGERGYDRDRYVASFLAAAPVDDPKIVVLCVIDDPDRRKAHYGGDVAAPVVRDVVDESLQYLGVPYDKPRGERPSRIASAR